MINDDGRRGHVGGCSTTQRACERRGRCSGVIGADAEVSRSREDKKYTDSSKQT